MNLLTQPLSIAHHPDVPYHRRGRFLPRTACACVVVFLCLSAPATRAQWTTQSITLTQGWNSVFLLVQPAPNDCDSVFGGISNVERACTYHSAYPTVQFIQDPGNLMPDAEDWLKWYPQSNPASFANSLFTVDCGKPYLVKLADGSDPQAWEPKGVPLIKAISWREDAYNWVGFRVSEANSPTFEDYFGADPAFAMNDIWRLDGSNWAAADPTETMRSGEAFWIKTASYTEFQGPLTADTGRRVGLDFGISLMEDVVRLRNPSSNLTTVTIVRLPGENPPPGMPPYAGEVPLWWWDATNGTFGAWDTNGIASMPSQEVGPGDEAAIRLAVSRGEMDVFTPPVGEYGHYQSLLDVEGSDGSRILVPVHALGLVLSNETGVAGLSSEGLWVGNVTVGEVSQPIPASTATNSPTEPVPVGPESSYQFQVILHVDSNGTARLLQHVNLMWDDEEQHLALVANDDRIAEFNGVALRDGVPVGRRISSAAFGCNAPVANEAPPGAATLRFTVGTEYDDLLNPFLHQYHPDHNNLTELGEARVEYTNSVSLITTNYYNEVYTNEVVLISTRESYAVARLIDMAFTDHDPAGLVTPGWGDNRAGGIWYEVVLGLRHQPIHAQGVFRLSRISRQPTLEL